MVVLDWDPLKQKGIEIELKDLIESLKIKPELEEAKAI